MTQSDEPKDRAEKGAADYDAHLTNAEDHMEAAARKAETSFREDTAGTEAHLAKAEDHMEAAARKAETQAPEKDAELRNRIAQAREHTSQK